MYFLFNNTSATMTGPRRAMIPIWPRAIISQCTGGLHLWTNGGCDVIKKNEWLNLKATAIHCLMHHSRSQIVSKERAYMIRTKRTNQVLYFGMFAITAENCSTLTADDSVVEFFIQSRSADNHPAARADIISDSSIKGRDTFTAL